VLKGLKKSSPGVEKSIRKYVGQYYDQETGLHYNYHRYYDPSLGRYLRPDPVGLKGDINLFVYANQNPINLIDPMGLKPTCEELDENYKACVKACGDVLDKCLDFADSSYKDCINFYYFLCDKINDPTSRKNCKRLAIITCNTGVSEIQVGCVVAYGACRAACALNMPGDCGCK
jgi:RHS repeat-associated protein